MFADLAGSTRLGEELDSEALREVMARYFDEMRAILQRHGGAVEKFIGDAVMAVFGLPVAREDDAVRAVKAAQQMSRRLLELNPELERSWGVTLANRIGVNTGEVVAGDPALGQRLVTGDAVNVAARLEQAAAAGTVLLGESTHRLVRKQVRVEPLEPLKVKGKSAPLQAYRLIAWTSDEPERARRLEAPIVGRAKELTALQAILETVTRERVCHLAILIGEPGIGKSRLMTQFASTIGDHAAVFRGHCLSYGEGITFWPVAEVLRQAAEVDADADADTTVARVAEMAGSMEESDAILARLAALLTLSDSYPVEDLFWAFRKTIEGLARTRAVVLVFDDIHWGEARFLDLIEHVLNKSTDHPLMLLCLARPELFQRRGWSTRERTTAFFLDSLGADESELLVSNILEGVPLSRQALDRIAETAGGNPLFIEEILGMLIAEGAIRREDGQWAGSEKLATLPLPKTLSALLAARLDALPRMERAVLERASVIGQVFYPGAVDHLMPPDLRPDVRPSLHSLMEKGFIALDPAAFAGEEAFRFRHILIRDAAYQHLLKRTRALLHEQFVEWLTTTAGERLSEFEEIVGYHLEQAYRYGQQLGPVDEAARTLAMRAAEHLAAAGRRSLAIGDAPAAVNLLDRAEQLWQREDLQRVLLLAELSEALEDVGDYSGATAVTDRAARVATAAGDHLAVAHARIAQLDQRMVTDPAGLVETAAHEADRLRPIFQRAEDQSGLMKVAMLERFVHWNTLHVAATEQALERALQHARLAKDRVNETRILVQLAHCLLGPTSVPEAIRRCRVLLEQVRVNRYHEASILSDLAVLVARDGDIAEARRLSRRSREMLEDMGFVVAAASYAQVSATIEMLADDPAAAERALRRHLDFLVEIGNRWALPTNAAMLARAVYAQGRLEEAEKLTNLSQSTAAPEDVDAQARWRVARALVLARRGHVAEAERMAQEAVRLVENTDMLDLQVEMLLDLGEVLLLADRLEDADEAARTALAVIERRGDVISAAKARAMLERIGGHKQRP